MNRTNKCVITGTKKAMWYKEQYENAGYYVEIEPYLRGVFTAPYRWTLQAWCKECGETMTFLEGLPTILPDMVDELIERGDNTHAYSPLTDLS